jgi:hypothetical protein
MSGGPEVSPGSVSAAAADASQSANFLIRWDELDIKDATRYVLGEGGFGRVLRGTWQV